ncbi:hypothetical protein MINS_12190 [Mycolicibacterium insubricum]|uniref:Uncharacterized protein n=1 Tax=Mycolicibacterium insubricum TaxID=444597 RepID=A0A1X0CKY3_9MYCO|nr:hypothetical protein [Mycolicibacterium insubricum]MCV7084116.1 hypothetical protein [Mycolicibacterium insubricum]ORA60783.1 hypothetical protein BST26_21415 [Mycolicibacterium insubricum]BBZ65790.1 hypothetical protein MINS_12190 [Mycolicibacterium insubricum]
MSVFGPDVTAGQVAEIEQNIAAVHELLAQGVREHQARLQQCTTADAELLAVITLTSHLVHLDSDTLVRFLALAMHRLATAANRTADQR